MLFWHVEDLREGVARRRVAAQNVVEPLLAGAVAHLPKLDRRCPFPVHVEEPPKVLDVGPRQVFQRRPVAAFIEGVQLATPCLLGGAMTRLLPLFRSTFRSYFRSVLGSRSRGLR